MKSPSRINPVSVTLALLAVGLVYGGWKFVPVYWTNVHVDRAMSSIEERSKRISLQKRDGIEERLLEELWTKVVDLGIDDEKLEIYFTDQYRVLHVKYEVTVEFLFGKSWTLDFHRTESIDRDDI